MGSLRLRLAASVAAALFHGACGSSPTQPSIPTPPSGPGSLDQKAFIEALFLGSGPLADRSSVGCAFEGTMAGWSPGAPVRIRLASNVAGSGRDAVFNIVPQLAEATGGVVTATIDPTDEADPRPRAGELTIAAFDDIADQCGGDTVGCFFLVAGAGGVIRSGRILGKQVRGDTRAIAHELGHGLFGFCHLDPTSTVFRNGPDKTPSSVMGFGGFDNRLTPDDVRAVAAVYSAGLRPGATRAQFVQAGLVDP